MRNYVFITSLTQSVDYRNMSTITKYSLTKVNSEGIIRHKNEVSEKYLIDLKTSFNSPFVTNFKVFKNAIVMSDTFKSRLESSITDNNPILTLVLMTVDRTTKNKDYIFVDNLSNVYKLSRSEIIDNKLHYRYSNINIVETVSGIKVMPLPRMYIPTIIKSRGQTK